MELVIVGLDRFIKLSSLRRCVDRKRYCYSELAITPGKCTDHSLYIHHSISPSARSQPVSSSLAHEPGSRPLCIWTNLRIGLLKLKLLIPLYSLVLFETACVSFAVVKDDYTLLSNYQHFQWSWRNSFVYQLQFLKNTVSDSPRNREVGKVMK